MPVSADRGAAPDDATLERLVLRAVAAVVAVILAAGVARVATVVGADGDASGAGAPSAGGAAGTAAGPPAGISLATYVAARTALLESLPAEREVTAAVSFGTYLTVNEAQVVLSAPGVLLDRLLVAPAGSEGEPVDPSRLGAWAAGAAAAAAAERAELERLLPTVDDPEFEHQYRLDIERLRVLSATASADGEVVFGAVVVGRAGALRAFAAKPAIRLVDPHVASGIRPEQIATAGEPRYRP